nr:hypothetical protein [Tanacetum cinerariifolium]
MIKRCTVDDDLNEKIKDHTSRRNLNEITASSTKIHREESKRTTSQNQRPKPRVLAVNKEKTLRKADAALKVNIIYFCEDHYEDILPVIMDNICRDKRKEVHARLDFGETSKKSRRVKEGSQNSSAGTLTARYRNPSERPKRRDRLRHNDENDSSPSRDHPRSRDRLRGIEESYGNTCSSYRIGARHRYHFCDRDRSRSMKRGKESESSLSR